MATAPGRTLRETSPPPAKVPRIVASCVAAVASLVLAVMLAAAPEWFGLPDSPELFEKVQDAGRGSEAVIFLWALIAIPLGGLLQTPVAVVRRARIGAGWALVTGYWLYVALLTVPAWLAEDLFPGPGAPGKSGGMFGAVVMLALAIPVAAVCWGTVFRPAPDVSGQLRKHLAAMAVLSFSFNGVFTSLMIGAAFRFPREGSFAMILPGGFMWGFLAGAAVGTWLGSALQTSPETRRTMITDAAGMARTAATILVCCLCVAQLGWFLPGGLVTLLGFAAPLVLWAQSDRHERLGRWMPFETLDVPKGVFD
jgi:hypothetical protein